LIIGDLVFRNHHRDWTCYTCIYEN